ncbi:hypothetical protein VC83_05984 [Pseudogymnoascus destructans]|uniref:Uncharacterized protein n=2 Tax=Pseudogymnoascus destructans TaxID=655981 RepID=L8G8M2_PSED2|nr:uncharacterized protein VC83_05984 [Pseudogymnoascus destructans]ELR08988.1 hypothetical protein GMDG_00606 [Pseudogymnoascus destructans 20631-21]OAF56994.2 hypothetical protein VC83_05984 [Pseudogymnoascus destructans]
MPFTPTTFSTSYEFPILSPPDVAPGTRVVGICGISSVRDENGAVPSDPSKDGWYHAQFYLLHQLLREQGVQQKWITSVSPDCIVDNYSQLTYPDIKGTRRIVLDRTMIQRGYMNDVKVVNPKSLRDELKDTLDIEVQDGMEYREPILLIVIGHGSMKDGGIHLHNRTFNSEQFRLWTMGAVNAGLVTPNPFTGREGGWLVVPSRLLMNRPLNCDGRGKTCGSVWMIEVLNSPAFKELMTPRDPSDKRMEERLVPELINAVYDSLIGGRVKCGGVDFDPDTDAWEIDFRRRRSKPLYKLEEAWYSLRSLSPGELPSVSSSSLLALPTNPVSGELPAELLNRLENLAGSSQSQQTTDYTVSTRRKLLPLIDAYRRSLPGLADDHSEALLSTLIHKVEDNPDVCLSRLRRVTAHLEYRFHLMELADRYVSCLDLQEQGRSCSGFDMEKWKREQPREQVDRLEKVVRILASRFVFPATILEKQGKVFPKPWEYLAMVMMERGGTSREFERDLEVILNFRKDRIRAATMAALKDKRVEEAMRKIDRHIKDTLEDDSDGRASLFDGDLWVIVQKD